MKLTVLLLAHNDEAYVRDTLGGVLAQRTGFEFDVVVSDGGSTDATLAIVEEFAVEYPGRVRVLRGHDVGDRTERTTLLRGLPECNGELIATINASDSWTEPGKLQRQVEYLDMRPDVAMCFHACQVRYVGADDQWWEMRCTPVDSARVTLRELLSGAPVQISTIVLRRSIVEELCGWPSLVSDWFIGIVAAHEGDVAYIDAVMSTNRQGVTGSLSGLSRGDQWAELVRRYEKLEWYVGPTYHEIVARTVAEASYIAAMEYERERAFDRAAAFLDRARHSKPQWLETHAMRYGMTGEQLLRSLRLRRALYRAPLIFSLWQSAARLLCNLRWAWTWTVVQLQSHMRLMRRRPVGSVVVSPNRAHATAKHPELAAVTLQWRIAGTEDIEVRVGRPDGVLLSRTGPLGTTDTGEWVADGTVFFVQDGDGAPLSLSHTIAVVRASVVCWSQKGVRAA